MEILYLQRYLLLKGREIYIRIALIFVGSFLWTVDLRLDFIDFYIITVK